MVGNSQKTKRTFGWVTVGAMLFLITPIEARAEPPAQPQPQSSSSASISVSSAIEPTVESPTQGPGSAAAPKATTFEDARTGFHLTLVAEGAKVCVVLPADSGDAAACEGFDIVTVRSAAKELESLFGMAVLQFSDWSVTVEIVRVPSEMNKRWEEVNVPEYLKGVKKGMEKEAPGFVFRGDSPGSTHDFVDFSIGKVLRYRSELDVPEGDPRYDTSRMVTYDMRTDGFSVSAIFVSDPGHQAELHRLAASSMSTMRIKPLSLKAAPLAERAKSLWGLMVTIGFGATVGALLALVRMRRKGGSNPAQRS